MIPWRQPLAGRSPRWQSRGLRRARVQVELLESRTLLSVTYFTPAQISTAYGFSQLTNNGSGQTIAIVDAYYDAKIASVLAREDLSAQECVDHLILAALDGGGSDNVTVILVRNR